MMCSLSPVRLYCFFFSSRRRHTRYWRDWSSDVCSSDLTGGPQGDTGLTGRKIIVDTYGGSAPHGGGAFSGKDATKVDRSGSYAARWVAKNLVTAGIARRCLVQVAYAIGVDHPASVMVETFGTAKVDPVTLSALVREHFDLRQIGRASCRERV